MWIKKEKPSKLLLILFEYFAFAILCGVAIILFFRWAAEVITLNYIGQQGGGVSTETEYWIGVAIIAAGVVIAFFTLILLLQQKFSYMIEISKAVEEMESGNLTKRIELIGEDELTDLAERINSLAQTMQEEFQVSEQMKKERFQTVASLSHDIRTPLTAVMSYLQFIRDEQYASQEQLQMYAEKAYEKAYRIKEMTDSLFENCLKDIEEKKVLEKVDGRQFLNQVFFDAKDFLEESGFVVDILKTPKESFSLQINRENMSRIFDNLISNIEKYADPIHPITIQAEIENEHLVIVQENVVIGEYQRKNVESHLLGLKGVERMIGEIGGIVLISNEDDIFSLTIRIPVEQNH
ncbi:MAG: HAMP domain-containing histidine kinase [Lachnospiraceae bacterium]|nr:HAMP domain-containing histidine kinase [Lachnospiraceae bacterium]